MRWLSLCLRSRRGRVTAVVRAAGVSLLWVAACVVNDSTSMPRLAVLALGFGYAMYGKRN